ncbi:LytTR family DNA-binding domain-containing protein [Ravibacter arvi]|uniref:LytR/AlgR family response regulator transcription factor n=1 Tax=Ravibacter arvi TaxID=2051041 RepID=UPI0031EE1487
MKLNCIAVDDEPLALGLVCTFIEKTPFLELAGSFSNGVDALQAIQNGGIDVAFLDIQMPDLTGLELARILEKSPERAPRVVFTTAFNQFAHEGYKVDALDYLLKPFNYEEFLKAATKAQQHFSLVRRAEESSGQLVSPKDNYLFLKVEYQMVRVLFEDILYIEGLKDYVKVHLESSLKPILSLTSLKSLEEKLAGKGFMRVHRSFIVNLDKISAVTKTSISIGTENIPVSEQYKEDFNRYLSQWM